MQTKLKKTIKFSLSIFICLAAGIIGSIFTFDAISTWYNTLNKPFFNPPNWLFGPAWTVLYILMGISLYLVWQQQNKKETKDAIIIFSVQLFLNALWPIVFFGLKLPIIAFVELIVLWIAVLITIIQFKKISKNAAYLLLPYIIWISFAALLNLSIVLLN